MLLRTHRPLHGIILRSSYLFESGMYFIEPLLSKQAKGHMSYFRRFLVTEALHLRYLHGKRKE
jgi:hypothetical protein